MVSAKADGPGHRLTQSRTVYITHPEGDAEYWMDPDIECNFKDGTMTIRNFLKLV